jgi:hypothetical protein
MKKKIYVLGTWKGIFIENFNDNIFKIYLSKENPSEIWKFDLSLIYGFPYCSKNFNGFIQNYY